jgi:hypothetical protein
MFEGNRPRHWPLFLARNVLAVFLRSRSFTGIRISFATQLRIEKMLELSFVVETFLISSFRETTSVIPFFPTRTCERSSLFVIPLGYFNFINALREFRVSTASPGYRLGCPVIRHSPAGLWWGMLVGRPRSHIEFGDPWAMEWRTSLVAYGVLGAWDLASLA